MTVARVATAEPCRAGRRWSARSVCSPTCGPGEGVTALVMVANVFLILCAYYFVKPLRDGWIATSDIAGLSKMEVKAYTSFAQGLVLIGVGVGCTRGWRRAGRGATLIVRSTLVCIANLCGFWLLRPDVGSANSCPASGIAFYVWVGMFGVFVVSQFWAFAADLYSDERGRRLLPMIAIGATAGAVAGSFLTDDAGAVRAARQRRAPAASPTSPLAGSILLTALADARGPAGDVDAAPRRPAAARGPATPGHDGRRPAPHPAPSLSCSPSPPSPCSPHWVSTNGENLLFKVVQEAVGMRARTPAASRDPPRP